MNLMFEGRLGTGTDMTIPRARLDVPACSARLCAPLFNLLHGRPGAGVGLCACFFSAFEVVRLQIAAGLERKATSAGG